MVIRSCLFNIAFWLWTFALGIIGLPFAFISKTLSFGIARLWAVVILWMLRVLCGITHEIRGKEYIPQGTALIASKHQSAWDTLIFWVLLKKPVYVLKRELIFIPVFGWHLLLLGSISIDRTAGAKAMKSMLRRAEARTQEGGSIVIFPEGTRIAVAANSVYHPGVAALYSHLKLPVTPVALNSGLLWGKNAFIKTPGIITIEFLPAIAPGMKSRDFMPLLQERIETATTALINEVSAT